VTDFCRSFGLSDLQIVSNSRGGTNFSCISAKQSLQDIVGQAASFYAVGGLICFEYVRGNVFVEQAIDTAMAKPSKSDQLDVAFVAIKSISSKLDALRNEELKAEKN
jgi:hypothetical protein